MDSAKIKIAIDGPAASGKSTTAREVARKLAYLYIDSGAMYRAITLKALQTGIMLNDTNQMENLAQNTMIEFKQHHTQTEIYLDNQNVSSLIRTPEVTEHITPVAANPQVRSILVEKQQILGRDGGIVMDGRDITTVVFPDAELKIYMKASAEERALRRVNEFQQKGVSSDYQQVLQEIRRRDQADANRKFGPLQQTADAIELDTTKMSIKAQVNQIYHLALQRIDQKTIDQKY